MMDNPIDETIQQNKDATKSVIVLTEEKLPLRKQLLYSLIPAIGITLALASIWGYRVIQKNTEALIKNRLSKEALLAQDILKVSLEQAATIPLSMASNPAILQAIESGNQQVIDNNLTALPISELENKFKATKLLKPNSELNHYLRETAKNSNFSEISIAERSGFNVGYSQPTSDFVQRDEAWWQMAKNNSQYISEPNFDTSSNSYSISLIQAVRDNRSGQFLGVIKAVLPISYLNRVSTNYLKNTDFFASQKIQIIDVKANQPITTIGGAKTVAESTIIGGDAIAEISSLLHNAIDNPQITSEDILSQLTSDIPLEQVTIKNLVSSDKNSASELNNFTVSFRYQNRQYTLAAIPKTSLIVAASIDRTEIIIAANKILPHFWFLITTLFLVTTGIILLTTRQVSKPLKELVLKVEAAASGNFEVRAETIGTRETVNLAYSFNNLIEQIQQYREQQAQIIQNAETTRQEAEALAEEQKNKNVRIQQELLELLGDVEGASSGDLTVRSRIGEGEIGIVADFFNSIIENLRDIVAQVKEAAEQVNVSVGENQQNISQLATEASQQAERITQTLASVEQITQSIQQVARNATEAAEVAHVASNKAEMGGESMELTVSSIQQLRGTIDQTAEKVKSLGEASQKISRVISLINQIAIQTNLLSINASIEAARAGEEGKGFAVVAEEVGALATQSSEATKEVSTIIAGIQTEITQVVEAMEVGIIQAEQGTRLVEKTKASLQQIVEVSYQIDHLVQSISKTTVSQAETSQNVTQLMEQIAQLSKRTSGFSQNASSSLESTVAIAKKLQSSVGTFKVERKD